MCPSEHLSVCPNTLYVLPLWKGGRTDRQMLGNLGTFTPEGRSNGRRRRPICEFFKKLIRFAALLLGRLEYLNAALAGYLDYIKNNLLIFG